MVGFYPGSFDLCHAGHMLAFKDASNECDYLIVGLHSDPTFDRPLKNKPIMSMEERRIILKGISYIDEIREYDTERDLMNLVMELQPNIYFIGEDWKNKEWTCKELCKELNIKVIYLQRKHNYSTSELRERIVKDFLDKSKGRILKEINK